MLYSVLLGLVSIGKFDFVPDTKDVKKKYFNLNEFFFPQIKVVIKTLLDNREYVFRYLISKGFAVFLKKLEQVCFLFLSFPRPFLLFFLEISI